jgi:hypothetical protein
MLYISMLQKISCLKKIKPYHPPKWGRLSLSVATK